MGTCSDTRRATAEGKDDREERKKVAFSAIPIVRQEIPSAKTMIYLKFHTFISTVINAVYTRVGLAVR